MFWRNPNKRKFIELATGLTLIFLVRKAVEAIFGFLVCQVFKKIWERHIQKWWDKIWPPSPGPKNTNSE
jgi:hypothetical protein